MSGGALAWAAGATRAVPADGRTVLVDFGAFGALSPVVGTAVEEYFLGALCVGVKVLCANGDTMRVSPGLLLEAGDLGNVAVLHRKAP